MEGIRQTKAAERRTSAILQMQINAFSPRQCLLGTERRVLEWMAATSKRRGIQATAKRRDIARNRGRLAAGTPCNILAAPRRVAHVTNGMCLASLLGSRLWQVRARAVCICRRMRGINAARLFGTYCAETMKRVRDVLASSRSAHKHPVPCSGKARGTGGSIRLKESGDRF